MGQEARRRYLWTVYHTPSKSGWTNQPVDLVVVAWRGSGEGYDVVQRLRVVAENLEHAKALAKGAFALWCTVHGVEEGS